MKYIKTYEKLDKPEVGDYVICRDNLSHASQDITNHFLSNNIGVIVKITKDLSTYCVKYYGIEIPDNVMLHYKNDFWARRNDIIQYSKDGR